MSKKLGIMQPYFMPYLGYFSLIKHTDQFILLDEVQFIRHGWIERNRILKQTGGWQYIAVPLESHTQKTKIRDILINNQNAWKKRILDQLGHYKGAPYFFKVKTLLQEIFSQEYEDIAHLNLKCLIEVCEYLQIETPISLFSEMNVTIEDVTSADEWALAICKKIEGVTEYWNPPGGKSFFDVDKYKKSNIDIKFQQIELSSYKQKQEEFIPGLSILDVIMFNSKWEINEMLDRYYFI